MMMRYDIRQYGAEAGTDQVQTEAIQRTIDAAAEQGGGTVLVPSGRWFTGTIWLKDNISLHLEAGAFLLGTNRPEDYPRRQAVDEGLVVSRRAGPRRMIGAWGCKHVSITGQGVIDGQGGCGGQIEDEMGAEGHPQNLQFIACEHVTVRDVQLRDAGSWMQVYLCCSNVLIDGINVWNHGHFTNDGLDIDGCQHVRVSNVYIDSHDDALVFKSTGPVPCRHIQVVNCHMRSRCHGIKFGTESVGGFEFISIRNCSVRPSAAENRRPPNTGVALECTDGGTMRFITIDGLMVEGVYTPFFVKLGNRLDRRLDEKEPPPGCMEDITLMNISGDSVDTYAPNVSGYPGHPIRRVLLKDINLVFEGGLPEEKILKEIPEYSEKYPEINMFIRHDKNGGRLPAYGLYARLVEDMLIKDVRFQVRSADAREPIVMDQVTDVKLENVRP